MEVGALTVTRFLTRLIMPIGAGAVVLGLLTIVKALGGFGSLKPLGSDARGEEPAASPSVNSSILEQVAVGLCGTLALVLVLLLAVNAGRSGISGSLWPAALLVMSLLLGAPAALWNTRYRVAGEGIATISIAGIAIVTGFSIGFLFVPLVLLMIWLCINQLLLSKPRPENDRW
jgi:hypothetical protein